MKILKKANTALMGSALVLASALMATSSISYAAPTVTGKGGCIMDKNGAAGRVENIPGGGSDDSQHVDYICKDTSAGLPDTGVIIPGSNGWDYDNFVTAGEMNGIIDQMYQELGSSYTYDPTKDNEQDNRLGGHDQEIGNINNNITNINADLTQVHNTLNNHETRIGDLEDGAVMYNRDANGNKTGGVTFNDGTGNPVKLSNVAAGSAGTDAVNVDQLTTALNALGGGSSINIDGTITAPTYNVGGVSYNNVGDALKAQADLSVQYVADENGKPTNTIALTGDGTGAPVKMTNLAAGTEDTDAVNYSQIKNNVGYDQNEDGSRGDSITLVGGSTGPVTIHNVADGKKDSDAATVRQVNQARQDSFDYTDQQVANLRDQNNARFDALSGEISDVRSEARAGVASAMAAAGLRFDDRPGKASIAGAMGGFKTATSMAVGAGYTSEDGRWRMNGTVAHSFSTNDTAWNAGASWTFN
uniref:Autotransporter adhesin (YadA-like) n=1 Tax=Ochrobactrum sp. LM19 TaxID=1449781 RepID=A0A0D5A0E7_9HYPH|nr:YadA-like family protein [Ochrobactrum sp. LM19]AJW30012.1 autotransporter adhesin (YadA-like) [Ochrobactrum sp. LM19]